GVTHAESLVPRIRRDPYVVGVAPFTYVKAMAYREGLTEGLIVKGVDLSAERSVTTIGSHIEPPLDSIPAVTASGKPGLVLGQELAERLGARVGDDVLLVTLQGDAASAFGFAPRLKPFRVVGV